MVVCPARSRIAASRHPGLYAMDTRHRVPLLAAVLLCASSHAAAQVVSPDQPLQELVRTALVYPQEKHEIQVTVASLFDRADDGHTWGMPIEVEYGLTDAWQIALEWQSVTRVRTPLERTTTVGGLDIGTKYSFMGIGGRPLHAALGLDVQLPTREAGWAMEPSAAFATVARGGVHVAGHVAATLAGRGQDEAIDEPDASGSEVEINLAAFRPVGAAVVAVELTLSAERWPDTPAHRLIPSLTFRLPWHAELGIGVPFTFHRPAGPFGLAVHLVLEP
jgi:hypothetical protein